MGSEIEIPSQSHTDSRRQSWDYACDSKVYFFPVLLWAEIKGILSREVKLGDETR